MSWEVQKGWKEEGGRGWKETERGKRNRGSWMVDVGAKEETRDKRDGRNAAGSVRSSHGITSQ